MHCKIIWWDMSSIFFRGTNAFNYSNIQYPGTFTKHLYCFLKLNHYLALMEPFLVLYFVFTFDTRRN